MDGRGFQGGFNLLELFAAVITTIDIIIVYAFLHVRKGKLILALWTSILNMVFPLIGFFAGQFSAHLFTAWSSLLSGLLLALIGIHILLQDDDIPALRKQLHPFIIALAVSLDTFSVSVSFGMLQMNKTLFIAASGLFSLIFSYGTLVFKSKLGRENGKVLRLIAGTSLLVMGVMSFLS